jgi:hypothetical protein
MWNSNLKVDFSSRTEEFWLLFQIGKNCNIFLDEFLNEYSLNKWNPVAAFYLVHMSNLFWWILKIQLFAKAKDKKKFSTDRRFRDSLNGLDNSFAA